MSTEPDAIFQSQHEVAEFNKHIASLLPTPESQPTEESLDGRSREELLAMLPPQLRLMIDPPKGWFRNTARMRKLMKKPPTYLHKNTPNSKSFARKIP